MSGYGWPLRLPQETGRLTGAAARGGNRLDGAAGGPAASVLVGDQPGQAAPGDRGRLRRVLPDLSPLRRAPEFRRLYAGQAASSAGSMITYVALPYQAYHLTHSSLVVGLLSVAELIPLVAAALLGGLLADAADRRRLILGAEAAGLLASGALAANAAAWHQLWLLFVLAVVAALPSGCSARRWTPWCRRWSPGTTCPPPPRSPAWSGTPPRSSARCSAGP
jgi:hypothetical protein